MNQADYDAISARILKFYKALVSREDVTAEIKEKILNLEPKISLFPADGYGFTKLFDLGCNINWLISGNGKMIRSKIVRPSKESIELFKQEAAVEFELNQQKESVDILDGNG